MPLLKARARSHLTLQCPECTKGIRIALDALVDGTGIRCRHCGTEAELARGLDGDTGRESWMLLDPLAEYADDEAQRRA